MSENKEQYVYVMSNASFPDDVLKIGWTREHPNIRANNLHTSGIPTPFTVEYVIITPDGSKIEKQIHTHLKTYRIKDNREFFKISKDILIQILTGELNLQITFITDLDAPTNKRTHGAANKINEMYETLKKDWDDFSSPLRKAKMRELVVIRKNDNQNTKPIVNTKPNIHSMDALDWVAFDDGTEEKQIRDVCYFIERDIKQYAEYVDNILHNYQEIKDRIGDKQLREDNKELKRWISNTHKDLNELKNKYIWDI
jgi:hypothetical protein